MPASGGILVRAEHHKNPPPGEPNTARLRNELRYKICRTLLTRLLAFGKLLGNSSGLAIIGRLAEVFVQQGTVKFRGWAILVALSLVVSGCGAQGLIPCSSSEPLTPAQQQLVDANKRF